jgi:hypothetical protein
MAASEMPRKAAISVSEMAELCEVSRSRWYELVDAGVFPPPVRHPSIKRPVYDADLQAMCLEIRETGIGHNGLPVLFNRKIAPKGKPLRREKPHSGRAVEETRTEVLLDSLKALGLSATPEAIKVAIAELYPEGTQSVPEGEIVRRLFLHLQRKG